MGLALNKRIGNSAFAFRGYNVSNHGRSLELLEHGDSGPIVASVLDRASAICERACSRKVDLQERIRTKAETSVDSFPEDVSMIVAMSVAQIECLEKFFGIKVAHSKLMLGYSIGELAALIIGGVFPMEEILPLPLTLSAEAASLADNVTMGVVFTRDQSLKLSDVRRLCVKISSEGNGLIAPSTHLAPNACLLLAEGSTLDRFQEMMKTEISDRLLLRRNKNKWPPLHTPILWKKSIPDRGALSLFQIPGGFTAPKPPIVSCVTGKPSYNDWNSRDLLIQWIDQPQLLWDAIYHLLETGVELVIHVGPEPNLIPNTVNRISQNVADQIKKGLIGGFGKRVVSSIAYRPWLSSLFVSQSAILRAPFVQHLILEDWLLDQQVQPTPILTNGASKESAVGSAPTKESTPSNAEVSS
jgi:[acyl-carrier-protein] S-malonyltransferase